MHFAVVQRILGMLLMLFSTSMLPPIVFSVHLIPELQPYLAQGWSHLFHVLLDLGWPLETDGSQWAFIYGFMVTFAIGFLAWLPVRNDRRELRFKFFGLLAIQFDSPCIFGDFLLLLRFSKQTDDHYHYSGKCKYHRGHIEEMNVS